MVNGALVARSVQRERPQQQQQQQQQRAVTDATIDVERRSSPAEI